MGAVFSSFYKNVTAAGTPEALGASTVQFNTAVFIAKRDATTANTGLAWVKYESDNAKGPIELYPGLGHHWIAPDKALVDASQFYVDTATSGDGILCQYALADWKAFSDVESKVENAIRSYLLTIGATLDDCSITAGITDEERTADNVNVYCDSITEMPVHSLNWLCSVKVEVRSQVGKEGSDNRLMRHRLRTAYIRDLLLDPDAEEIVQSLGHSLAVYRNGIFDVQCEQGVEGRQWVSAISFNMKVCAGSNLV